MTALRSLRPRLLLGAAACAACALLASHARAFSLRVSPIPIAISGGADSTMVELANEATEPARMQAQVYDWTQTPTGEDKLEATSELLVFPSMLTVAPGATRKVRVGTQGGYGAVEKTFRVIFAELPPDSTPADQKEEMLKLVSHVSVPVFVTPPGATPALKVENPTVTNDHVRFGVHDVGAAHALVNKVRLEAFGENGRSMGSTEVTGWYVLPGVVRPFDVDLKNKVPCAGAKSLVITAVAGDVASASATIDHPACN